MKRLLTILAFAPAMLMAQQSGLSVVYDFKSKTTSPVVTTPLYRLDDVGGIPWLDVDVLAFAGASMRHNRPTLGTGGLALAVTHRLADRLDAVLGIAGRLDAGGVPVATGILAGIAIRF